MKIIFFTHKDNPCKIYSYSPDVAKDGVNEIIWVDWEESEEGIISQKYTTETIDKYFKTGEWIYHDDFECEWDVKC